MAIILQFFWLFGVHSSAKSTSPLYLTVCPNVKDHQGDFSSQRRFSTVYEAQRAARRMLAAGHTGDVIVELCDGRHPLIDALILSHEDVAPEKYSTEYRGPVGGHAILDSGLKITGWAPDPTMPGVWKATIPPGYESRQLWVDGLRAPRAHANPANCSGGPAVPKAGCRRTLKGGTLTDVGYINVSDSMNAHLPPSLEKWLPGSELVFGKGASGASWTEPRCTVASVSRSKGGAGVDIVMSQPCWDRAQMKNGLKPGTGQDVRWPSDIENAKVLLDEPGEWIGDWQAHTIWYMPRPGQTPSSVSAILGTVPAGDQGSAVVTLPGAERIRFTNLGFSHQTWLQPSGPGGYVDLQSGYFFNFPATGKGTVLHGVPGALALHGAHDVNISNCTFEHLGLTGVLADGGSRNIRIVGSRFSDTSGSAVSLGNVSTPLTPEDKQDGLFLVSGNAITNTGAEYTGCAGVMAGYVVQTSIVHNDISDSSNGAVCIGWGWGANNTMHSNTVSHNHIVRSNSILYDCGSIYTLSSQPNSEVAYNYLENQVLLYGSLYHDAKSAGFHTHHNVVVNGPMWLYLQWGPLGPVHDIIVEHNWHNQTVAGGCALPEHKATCPQNVTIRNNILVSGSDWPAEAIAVERAAGITPDSRRLDRSDSF